MSSMPWIQNIEFSLIFSNEFISWIHIYEIRFMNSDLIKASECDDVVKPGTGSTLFYINSWAMVSPSDHPVCWKSKHKLITGVSTVNIALKVDLSAVLHPTGMWSNTSIYVLIHTNTIPCRFSTRVFARAHVLARIVVCIGMYCASIEHVL